MQEEHAQISVVQIYFEGIFWLIFVIPCNFGWFSFSVSEFVFHFPSLNRMFIVSSCGYKYTSGHQSVHSGFNLENIWHIIVYYSGIV